MNYLRNEKANTFVFSEDHKKALRIQNKESPLGSTAIEDELKEERVMKSHSMLLRWISISGSLNKMLFSMINEMIGLNIMSERDLSDREHGLIRSVKRESLGSYMPCSSRVINIIMKPYS